jgi:chromosome segregation ATPase
MAENIGALILPIGADASQFNRSINDVKVAFKELSNTIASTPFNLVTDKQKLELNALKETLSILTTDVKEFGQALQFPENSILGLKKRIQELNDEKIRLDPTTSENKIIELTQEIEKLEDKLKSVNNLGKSVGNTSGGFSKGVDKIADSSKKTRTALTSLSLVAQDLPFGFIAIQNNLPNLITAFGNLDTKTNGIKGALKDLGSALVGPAGLFLAFSVVTAGITFAIQKYGSLSNAITALVSDNEDLAKTIAKARKEYESYNNSLNGIELSVKKSDATEQGKIETIKILTETVTNLQNSESKRSNALNQLKSIDKDYYGSFTTSASDADKLRQATDKLTESIIKQARVKGLESRITQITTALLDIEDAQAKVAPAFGKSAKKVEQALGKAGQFGALTFQDIGDVINLSNITSKLQEGDAAIEQETDRLEKTKERLREELDGIINIGKTGAGKDFVLKIESQDLDAAFNLEKIRSNVEGLGNIILDTNKTIQERKNALKELVAVNPQVFNGLTLEKNGLQTLKTTVEEYTRSLQVLIKQREFDARASQLNAQFRNAQTKATEDAVKAEEDAFENIVKLTYAQDQYGNSTDKIVQKNKDFVNGLKELQDINEGVIDDLTKGLNLENKYQDAIKNLLNFEEFQKASVDRIARNFRFLQNPLEDLFGTILEDGIANWKAFGDAVVKEVKKIVAALLAKGVIQLLASILAPGSGALVGAALEGVSDDALSGWLDLFDNNQKINFSGIQGGGMQMTGQVVFVQRGSDLVGVLNRTNSTINRVG